MNKKIILTGALLLCSAFSMIAQTQSIQNPSLFHYFTFPSAHGKVNKTAFSRLQEFASKSCNIKIFIHAGKLCWYFENNKIPCMGYADFVQELIQTMYKNPESDWKTLLTGSAAAHYGSAGDMILAFFREKEQYQNDPPPMLLVQHQYLFDRMLSGTKMSKLHKKRLCRSRGELDLLTLQHFARAVRFRLAHMPADLKKRCLAAWKEKDVSGKDPSSQKVFKHFRKVYMDKLHSACRSNNLEP